MRYIVVLIAVLFLVSGCTICERPFIKVNGQCCLDDDNNNICDTVSVSENASVQPAKPEVPDAKTGEEAAQAGNETLFRHSLGDITVSSRVYEPTPDEETDVMVSTMGYQELKGGQLTFTPMCAKNHLMGIMLNGELVSSVNVVCGKLQNVTMPRSAFLEGRNPLKFSTAYGPFMVRNVSVRVNFDNSAPITQEFDNFVIESVKRTIELASKNQVTMMNYYDQPFTVSEREFPGDFKATLDSDRDGLMVIYLNGKRIFDGEVSKGKFSVNLPKDDISLGSNRIRYIILP